MKEVKDAPSLATFSLNPKHYERGPLRPGFSRRQLLLCCLPRCACCRLSRPALCFLPSLKAARFAALFLSQRRFVAVI
jgi:hypothetical protein